MVKDIQHRFVERNIGGRYIRILQTRKLVIPHDSLTGAATWSEWKDVPLVKEEQT